MNHTKGNSYPEDMSKLCELLSERGIKFKLRKHPIAEGEPKVKEIIGYFPTGEWQVIINETYSVIRGAVSFGNYEIMAIKPTSYFQSPERFEKPEELVDDLFAKNIK